MMKRDFRTLKELADETGLSEKTLRRQIEAGNLPAYRPDPRGKYLVRPNDFEEWIESKRVAVQGDPEVREILRDLAAMEPAGRRAH